MKLCLCSHVHKSPKWSVAFPNDPSGPGHLSSLLMITRSLDNLIAELALEFKFPDSQSRNPGPNPAFTGNV